MSRAWSRFVEFLARPGSGPLVWAIVAICAVSLALDPAGDYPGSYQGPGLTVDEIFNVELGAGLADRVLTGDIPGAVRLGQTLPDHPPLARLWLGLFHEAIVLIVPPRGDHAPLVVAAARFGSAVAFGILVWLVGTAAARWYGPCAGWGASVSLILMPRLFGHAHLAALETVLNLTYLAAVLSVARQWSTAQAPTWRTAAWCGVWLGLALLTKIQAIFIPVPVIAWAILNWRQRAILPLAIWGGVGGSVFFCGWPWLWLDPIGNIWKYLGQASDRTSIQVWYLGQAFADKQVPWHYPWVLFATTVPVGLHLLGFWGLLTRRTLPTTTPVAGPKHGAACLLLGSLSFPLVVFSMPGVAVYDGERLFLIVFPLWAVFVGKGSAAGWQWLRERTSSKIATSLLAVCLAAQSVGLWVLAPCWLSYYNAAVGGLSGADKLGLQITYWGDSVTRELWLKTASTVPPDAAVAVAPVLHQFQLPADFLQCPALRERGVRLQSFDQTAPADYLVVFFRKEYLPIDWKPEPPGYRRLASVTRQGVILAGLYQRADVRGATPH